MTVVRIRPGAGWPCRITVLLLGGLLSGCGEPGSARGPIPASPATPTPAPEPVPPISGPCGDLSIAAQHQGIPDPTEGLPRGVFRLSGLSPETAVDVSAPYRPGWPHPAPSAAIIREFAGTGSSDWQLTIEWIGTLELAVVTPGCKPVAIRCSVVDCSVG